MAEELLVNPDVILGHMTISELLFEFAAAARTTDLLNFPHRFHRAIDILDDYEVEIAFEFAKPVYPRPRSEEHTSELQSHSDLVCRLLLEKKKKIYDNKLKKINWTMK